MAMAGSYFIAGLYGTNFSDGRGNVAVNVEYARQENAWGDDHLANFLRDALSRLSTSILIRQEAMAILTAS